MSIRAAAAVCLLFALIASTPSFAQNASPLPEAAATALVAIAPQTPDERVLVGRWGTGAHTVDGTTPGELELRADGTMQLAPEGFLSVDGIWRATPATGTLVFTVEDAGEATMRYELVEGRLVLHYVNGISQPFTKLPALQAVPH